MKKPAQPIIASRRLASGVWLSLLLFGMAGASWAETATTAKGMEVSCKGRGTLDADGHLASCVLSANTAFRNSYGDAQQSAAAGGIPCKSGGTATFYPDGNLESCKLSAHSPVSITGHDATGNPVTLTFFCASGSVFSLAANGLVTRCELASNLALPAGKTCKARNIIAIADNLALTCTNSAGADAVTGGTKYKNYLEDVDKGTNFFSADHEYQLGAQYSSQMNQQLSLFDDQEILSYIQSLGDRLVASSRRPDLQCRYFVVNTSEVNAFAVPGCFVYVNRGLVDLAQTEGQLAGVLSHEIGHVIAHHGVKLMSHNMLLQMIVQGIAEAVGQKSHTLESLVELGGGLAYLFSALKYSRDDEHQADALGAETMAAAGYDPHDLVDFFRELDPTQNPDAGQHLLGIMSTHPLTPDREGALLQQIAGMSYHADRESAGSRDLVACKAELSAYPYPPAGQEVTLSAALASLKQQ